MFSCSALGFKAVDLMYSDFQYFKERSVFWVEVKSLVPEISTVIFQKHIFHKIQPVVQFALLISVF